jgi:AcrR family transcriptional regulator
VAGKRYGGLTAEERREQRRLRLEEAADSVVRRHGLAAVTVRSVITEAGLNERYLYESFSGIDELLAATFANLRTRLSDAVVTAVEAAPHTPRDAIRATMACLVDLVSRDELVRQMVFEDAPDHPNFSALRRQGRDDFQSLIRRYGELHYGVAREPLQQRRVDHVMAMFTGGFFEIVERWLDGRLSLSQEEIVDFTVDLVFAGSEHLVNSAR